MGVKVKQKIYDGIVWISSPTIEKLPFYILLLGLITTLLINLLFVRLYWYDEILLTNISGHDPKGIIEAISSTPHPIGFYLFLKLLNIDNVIQTKLISIFIYYLLMTLITVYAYRNRILKDFKLSVGLSLFFSSSTHFLISSYVKHDTLTFPILYLLFLITFAFLQQQRKGDIGKITISNILVLFLLFIGYLPYVIAIGMLFFQSILSKEKLKSFVLFFFQLVVLWVYYFLFLAGQLRNNSGRLGWLSEDINDPMNGLGMHFTGIIAYNILTLIPLTLFILFLVYFFYQRRSGIKKNYERFIIFSAFVLIIFSQVTNSFVRPRYAALLYMILSIVAGWGLNSLFEKRNKLLYIVIFSFFVFDFSVYGSKLIGAQATSGYVNNRVEEFSRDEKVMVLGDHPLEPYLQKVNWGNDNLIPVSVYYPGLFDNLEHITEKQLSVIGQSTESLDKQEILSVLNKYNSKKAIYLMNKNADYYDPEYKVLEILKKRCKEYDEFPDLYYLFDSCKFRN